MIIGIIGQPFLGLSSLHTIEESLFFILLAFSKIKFGLSTNLFSFSEKSTASSQESKPFNRFQNLNCVYSISFFLPPGNVCPENDNR